MLIRLVDGLVGVFSPEWALRRTTARISLQQMAAYTGQTSTSGYKAAKLNRFTKTWSPGGRDENSQPRGDIARLRANSWELWRNNAQAKKICRSIESKVIGKGMSPMSFATLPSGEPHLEFRKMVKSLWTDMHERLDFRGRPGFGGQNFTDLAKTALRSTVLGGEVFFRFRTSNEKSEDRLPPTSVQLIHADRLAETNLIDGLKILTENFYYGIELDSNERRVAYHFLKYHPTDPRGSAEQVAVRIPSSEVGHLYIAEDIDQLRGVPWFSAALMKMRDTGDYEFNELKAAAVSACVVLGYRRSSGQSTFGLNSPDDWDLTDADGNKLTSMQPGMLIDLGRNGELQGFNPQRPNANAGEFISHMVRSQAISVPGVKGTTLTGDYRNSSFSSEKAADNDAWPEIEGVQDWMASTFYQPIYERLITEAVISGYFSGVVDTEDFVSRKSQYLKAGWQGPVSRSINPTDDAKAARERIRNGQSSPQIEAALLGRDWQEIIKQVAEFVEYCEEMEVPESFIAQALGIDQDDEPLLLAGEESTEDTGADNAAEGMSS